ncbi:hypothetical protein F2Q69_00034314 [Brassica cretica]|uniref:Uncharacterized protein n=1 Tax=Brassica cretica TaxID=69181 RepID=A0A8S9SBL2_BRACR|nr:hypothetical protein F2Q69_00034314 [Brassica cretica]
MSGNTKEKIIVRNNAGKTTPTATAPMANTYANATVVEKIKNLDATFRHRKCNETSSRFLCLNIKGNDKFYQTPINFERTGSDSDRSFSFLVRLGRTACTDGRTDGLTDYFDPIFEFDHQEFSKATILKLSDDLGHIWSSSVSEKLHSGRTDRPAHVLVLTAGCAAKYIESGQK